MVSAFERISKRASRASVPLVATLALAGMAAAGGAAAPASAVAGQYHVYSCRTPAGESAPADGWSGAVAVEGKTDDIATNSCADGGALIAALGDQTDHIANTDRARWSFEVPLGDELVAATLWRAGYVHGTSSETGSYQLALAGPALTNPFDECVFGTGCDDLGEPGSPMAGVNRFVVPSANLGSHLYAEASCGASLPGGECQSTPGDPNGYSAVLYVYAADVLLEQSAAPSASNASGALATAPTVSGVSDVAFSASDPGSGIYEAVFTVDGQVVQRGVVNEEGGRCRSVGQTTDGLPAFVYLQPCPASVNAVVGFETTRVSNGTHSLVVSVTDAAGNSATVLERAITVDNPTPPGTPSPNGTNASAQATMALAWKGSRKARLTTAYGHGETIVGRLTGPGGAPIAGAKIDVLATPAYAGARVAAMASPMTGTDGRFTVQIPAGVSSRSLRFAYSSTMGSSPAVTKTLTLTVRAGVTLRIAPRVASVGRSIYFSGHLRGGPVPSGGKLLVLEARSPGGTWLEFDVVRSDAKGRYHASYRFKFAGPAKYQFRVLCEAEADYPFATGSSRVMGVFER
jgi:hypothetical protein